MAWTDERIDDTVTRLFDEMREMRVEMREMRTEMHTEFRAVRSELAAGQRQQVMIGWAIAGALLAQLVAFVVTQS